MKAVVFLCGRTDDIPYRLCETVRGALEYAEWLKGWPNDQLTDWANEVLEHRELSEVIAIDVVAFDADGRPHSHSNIWHVDD